MVRIYPSMFKLIKLGNSFLILHLQINLGETSPSKQRKQEVEVTSNLSRNFSDT